ncbi:MAG TPA: sialidase family protein [Draconibacterium sp.]|nr:sialidase family protein [Draconibacterium sp.]
MKKLVIRFFGILFFMAFVITSSLAQINAYVDTLYVPAKEDPEPGSMYPRVICLEHQQNGGNGILLATFEHYIPGMRSFPIYRSTDNGKNWKLFSKVEDTYKGHGNKYQPVLFELPKQIGDFPAGTILCAGNMIPEDNSSTELTLYKSSDGGKNWDFVSSIVEGGRAIYNPELNESPVWEPYLYLDDEDNLICYYSDEQRKSQNFNQHLCHRVSTDGGKTWGEEVIDVAVPDMTTRPGMPIVQKLPNGKFFMIYEVVGLPDVPVYFRLSDNGRDWGEPMHLKTKILDSKANFLRGTPYIVWTPLGGKNGTLIATPHRMMIDGEAVGNGMMINKNLGEGPWTLVKTAIDWNPDMHSGGYSQAMAITNDGKSLINIVPVPFDGNKSMLIYAIYDIEDIIGQ